MFVTRSEKMRLAFTLVNGQIWKDRVAESAIFIFLVLECTNTSERSCDAATIVRLCCRDYNIQQQWLHKDVPHPDILILISYIKGENMHFSLQFPKMIVWYIQVAEQWRWFWKLWVFKLSWFMLFHGLALMPSHTLHQSCAKYQIVSDPE